jgi:hypothetical protein
MPYRALLTTMKTGGLFLSATILGVVEIHFVPPPGRLLLLGIAIALDLMTGLVKSWSKSVPTTSGGLKRTGVKIGLYAGIICATWLLANIMGDVTNQKFDYGNIVTFTIGFLTLVEIYSIFENVYEADPESAVSVYLIGPALKWMKGTLEEHNPFKKRLPGK